MTARPPEPTPTDDADLAAWVEPALEHGEGSA